MTYNVKNGGHDGIDNSRLDSILEVITTVDPDILALQELMYFDRPGLELVYRVENETGLRGFLGTAGTGQHVAIFVRKNLNIIATHVDSKNFHHATVRVTFDAKGTKATVISAHLCPHGGANRLGEAQRLANAAKDDRFVVLMGDLNSLDPWDSHIERVRNLPSHYRARHLMPGSSDEVDTRAIATLEIAGFIDLHRHFGGSEAEHTAPTLAGGGAEFSSIRVDYILGTPPAKNVAKQCYVVRRPTSVEHASDHYPLVADFDLEI